MLRHAYVAKGLDFRDRIADDLLHRVTRTVELRLWINAHDDVEQTWDCKCVWLDVYISDA